MRHHCSCLGFPACRDPARGPGSLRSTRAPGCGQRAHTRSHGMATRRGNAEGAVLPRAYRPLPPPSSPSAAPGGLPSPVCTPYTLPGRALSTTCAVYTCPCVGRDTWYHAMRYHEMLLKCSEKWKISLKQSVSVHNYYFFRLQHIFPYMSSNMSSKLYLVHGGSSDKFRRVRAIKRRGKNK